MYLMHEDLARAHMSARLEQARELRRGHQLSRAKKLARKAERASQQARLLQAVNTRVSALAARLEELERENREMRELAHLDELTGLGNRRGFHRQLHYALDFVARYGGVVSIVLLDLDGMKQVNDALGHPAGDLALRRVGEILRTTLRVTDHAARLGGDEFAMVMPATAGRRRAHFHARSHTGVRRAWIGSPFRNRRKSLANSPAEA